MYKNDWISAEIDTPHTHTSVQGARKVKNMNSYSKVGVNFHQPLYKMISENLPRIDFNDLCKSM